MITLELGGRSMRFCADGRPLSEPLPLGATLLRERWLRHEPPRPQEIEAAIEVVEDIVMPLHGRWAADTTLELAPQDDVARRLASMVQGLDRDRLEDLFNRATAIACGRPATHDPLLAEAELVAGLVIVREAMHHLSFTRIVG